MNSVILKKTENHSLRKPTSLALLWMRKVRINFLMLLTCCPHGVIAWSKEMDDLVETSTNLASAKFTDNNTIKIITTQRSSVESSKNNASAMVESCLRLAGAEVVHSDGYPGWKPNLTSEILKITRKSYIDFIRERTIGKSNTCRSGMRTCI